MRLTDIEWARVRYDWEYECMSFRQLCCKYHIGGIATISDRKKKEGWNRERVQLMLKRRRELLIELHALDKALYQPVLGL